MQGDPHRALRLVQDSGDRCGIQAGQHPERHRLGLIYRQLGQQPDRAPNRQGVQHLILDQFIIGYSSHAFVDGNRGPAFPCPGVVNRPVPTNCKEPPPEIFVTTSEPWQVTYDLQPGLAGDIVRAITGEDAQIAQQTGLQLMPQLKETRFVT